MTNTSETESLGNAPEDIVPRLIEFSPDGLATKQELLELTKAAGKWADVTHRNAETTLSISKSVVFLAHDYAARNSRGAVAYGALRDIAAFFAAGYIITDIIRSLS